MPEILQLNDFALTRLQVDWIAPDVPTADDESLRGDPAIDYDVLRHHDNPYSMVLQFRIKIAPSKGQNFGYAIEAEIAGFFDFPKTMTEEQVQYLIRVNGGTILYGILRGQISLFTGPFPGGKFMLPAVCMTDVVKDIEARKNKAGRKAAKKKRAEPAVSARKTASAKKTTETGKKVAAKKNVAKRKKMSN